MSLGIHLGHLLVVWFIQCAAGHVFTRPIRIKRRNHKLLRTFHRHGPLLGHHVNPHHGWVTCFAERHALPNPAYQQPVIVRIRFNAFPTTVRQGAHRFEQQKAVLRRGRKEASSPRFLHQMFEVFSGLESKKGESEPVLPPGFAMAPAAVAARLGKHRNNLIGEIHRSDRFDVLHGHLD